MPTMNWPPRDPSGAEMIHLFTIDGHYTAAYWRARAEETRARAEAMHDGYARIAMTTVAQMYDRMAARSSSTSASPTRSRASTCPERTTGR
jgi:hypothetical protein